MLQLPGPRAARGALGARPRLQVYQVRGAGGRVIDVVRLHPSTLRAYPKRALPLPTSLTFRHGVFPRGVLLHALLIACVTAQIVLVNTSSAAFSSNLHDSWVDWLFLPGFDEYAGPELSFRDDTYFLYHAEGLNSSLAALMSSYFTRVTGPAADVIDAIEGFVPGDPATAGLAPPVLSYTQWGAGGSAQSQSVTLHTLGDFYDWLASVGGEGAPNKLGRRQPSDVPDVYDGAVGEDANETADEVGGGGSMLRLLRMAVAPLWLALGRRPSCPSPLQLLLLRFIEDSASLFRRRRILLIMFLLLPRPPGRPSSSPWTASPYRCSCGRITLTTPPSRRAPASRADRRECTARRRRVRRCPAPRVRAAPRRRADPRRARCRARPRSRRAPAPP